MRPGSPSPAARTEELAPGHLRLLLVAAFGSTFDRFVVPPMLLAIAAEFGAPLDAVATAAGAYFLLYGCTQPLWGALSDRLGRVRLMRLALAGAALAALASTLAPNLTSLVVARAVAGGLFAAVIPSSLVYVGDTVEFSRRPRTFADLAASNALATAAATLVGGVLATTVSWRVGFLLPGLLAAGLVVALRRLPEPSRERPSGSVVAQFGVVLRRPWAVLVIALALVEGGVVLGTLTFLAPALESAGESAALAGAVVALYGAGTLVMTRLLNVPRRRPSAPVLIALGAALIVVGFATAAFGQGVANVVVAAACAGAGFASIHPTLQTWATDVAPAARATTISLFAGGLFIGSSAATALAAPLAERSAYGLVFGVAALAAVPLGVVCVLARARYRPAATG